MFGSGAYHCVFVGSQVSTYIFFLALKMSKARIFNLIMIGIRAIIKTIRPIECNLKKSFLNSMAVIFVFKLIFFFAKIQIT